MKNVILALIFVLLMVTAAMAVSKTRGANVGVNGVPAAGAVDMKNCPPSACTMKKDQGLQGQCTKGAKQRTCPITGKPI